MNQSVRQLPTNRRRAPQEKRERLLAAAKTLFSKQGFDATTTAQIARQAGVSEGILFHHFGSKKGLFDQLAEAFAETSVQQTVPAATELTEEQVVRAAFDLADANPVFYDMLAKGSGELSESDLYRHSRVLIDAIASRLEAGMRVGSIRVGEPQVMAEMQFAMVGAAYRAWRRSGKKALRETYLREAVNCMTAMLSPIPNSTQTAASEAKPQGGHDE